MTSFHPNNLAIAFKSVLATTMIAATFAATPVVGQTNEVRNDYRSPAFSYAKGSARTSKASWQKHQPQSKHRVPNFAPSQRSAKAGLYDLTESNNDFSNSRRPTFSTAQGDSRHSEPQKKKTRWTNEPENSIQARGTKSKNTNVRWTNNPENSVYERGTKSQQQKTRWTNEPEFSVHDRRSNEGPSFSLAKLLGPSSEELTELHDDADDDVTTYEDGRNAVTKLQVSGTATLDMPGNCLNGDAVEYRFSSDNPAFAFQTGSSMPITQPEIDESNPGLTVWTFDAAQGPNPYFGGEELHVVHSKNGLIFCTWTAKCRIEIDTANHGEVTQIWNGQFEIVGGTGVYRFATGNWTFAMMTELNLDALSENAHFEFAGNMNMGVRFENDPESPTSVTN